MEGSAASEVCGSFELSAAELPMDHDGLPGGAGCTSDAAPLCRLPSGQTALVKEWHRAAVDPLPRDCTIKIANATLWLRDGDKYRRRDDNMNHWLRLDRHPEIRSARLPSSRHNLS